MKEAFCGKCPGNKDLPPNVDAYHLPRSISEIGIGGYEEQLKCLDTNWVEEPFIVAMANVEGSQDGDHPQGTFEEALPKEIITEQNWSNFIEKQDSGTTVRAGAQNQPKPQNRSTMATQEEDNGAEVARTFSQIMSDDCSRLRSYRDIRLGPDESWVIREGSLVICLDHKYTDDSNFQARRPDQFEFVQGDMYVVCRIYGDLWALCAKVTLNSPVELSGKIRNTPKSFQSLGFLPLCAVTLAANFSSFMRRCAEYEKKSSRGGPQTPGNGAEYDKSSRGGPQTPRNGAEYDKKSSRGGLQTPSNGLAVTPPYRSHSMTASSEIFEKSLPKQLQLPSLVFELCGGGGSDSDEDGKEFKMGSVWKARSGQLERRMTLKKVWHRLTSSDPSAQLEPTGSTSECQQQTAPASLPPPALRRAGAQRHSETSDQTKLPDMVEKPQKSESMKAPAVTVQPEGLNKRRKSVRDLLFNEERWKRTSDRGAHQSDK
ncbi:hypothetical protein Plec18167_006942 [Paecilomyces lecythidis]|uniref:SANTA domain-containing protein n=1 Tax=Paecilomyces lecythidis TaxID=3004212 RepID=A0ABR3X7Z0_9EURO